MIRPNTRTSIPELSRPATPHHAEHQISDPADLLPTREASSPDIAPQDFPALAAMGHGTRGRLSALVAVLVSGDSPHEDMEQRHSLPVEEEGSRAVLDMGVVQSRPLCQVQDDEVPPLVNSQTTGNERTHACTSVATRRRELGRTNQATNKAQRSDEKQGVQKHSAPLQVKHAEVASDLCARRASSVQDPAQDSRLGHNSPVRSCQRSSAAAIEPVQQVQKPQRSAPYARQDHVSQHRANVAWINPDGLAAPAKRSTRSTKREGNISALTDLEWAVNSAIVGGHGEACDTGVVTGFGRKRLRDGSTATEGHIAKASCAVIQRSRIKRRVKSTASASAAELKAGVCPGSSLANLNRTDTSQVRQSRCCHL